MTICSTCQGVMSQANYKLQNDPAYLAKINETLALEGLNTRAQLRLATCFGSSSRTSAWTR